MQNHAYWQVEDEEERSEDIATEGNVGIFNTDENKSITWEEGIKGKNEDFLASFQVASKSRVTKTTGNMFNHTSDKKKVN